jgi:phage gp29-like protein
MLEDTDRLYATMYHDWDVLQKDSNDLAEAVQTLDWTVAPYVGDGEEATPEAQAVAKVVTDALWKRSPQKPGTFGHSFTQLLGALVHGKFRGFNVHEVEWKFDGDMWFPAMFHQLPAQFMRWEYEAGKPDRLLFVPDGETEEPRPFPDNKFIVALNTTGPDHPLYNATYYPLIAWFGAFKFGLGWFMEYCQKYGLPKLVFHYESESDRRQLEHDLSEEKVLNNILLKGDRTVDIANAPASGASLPQRELLNLAESACHKLILGQTLTSDTSEHGGSLAQAKVHAGVQADVVRKTADYVADILNTQLIPTIVLLNYGTTDVPMPELRAKIPQEGVTQERVQVVKTALEIKGMKLKKSEVYEFTGFSQPADDDEVFEAAAEQPQHGGFGAPFGQEPPPGGEGPQKGQQEPEESKDEEPVSAAKAEVRTDPAQSWLAPLKKELLAARRDGASLADLRKRLVSMRPDTKALARAFANNILAGLSDEGEEVEAANPYGCNQYGEGWASEHNGKRSEPGKPMKKGDPTPATKKAEEDAVKKAEEEAARKEAIAKQKAEEAAKKAAEEEAARKAEEEARKAEEAKRAEEEAKKAAEEAKKAEAEAEKLKKKQEAKLNKKQEKLSAKHTELTQLAESLNKDAPGRVNEVLVANTTDWWAHSLAAKAKGVLEAKTPEEKKEALALYAHDLKKAEKKFLAFKEKIDHQKGLDAKYKQKQPASQTQKPQQHPSAKTSVPEALVSSPKKPEGQQIINKPSSVSDVDQKKLADAGREISMSIGNLPNKQEAKYNCVAIAKAGAKSLVKVWKKLPFAEKKALHYYTCSSYSAINRDLREGTNDSVYTKDFKKAMKKMAIGKDCTVARGEGIERVMGYLPSDYKFTDVFQLAKDLNERAASGADMVIRNKQALSTTLSNSPFSGAVQTQIHVKAGTKGACVAPISGNEDGAFNQDYDEINLASYMKESYSGEREVLLSPDSNTRFLRAGVKKNANGNFVLYLEEETL